MMMDREMILTHISKDERDKVYERVKKDRKIILLMIVLFDIFCVILGMIDCIFMDEENLRDIFLLGWFGTCTMLIFANSMGSAWRPPTDDEIEDLGGKIL